LSTSGVIAAECLTSEAQICFEKGLKRCQLVTLKTLDTFELPRMGLPQPQFRGYS
jgi:hypothetical protein